MNGGWVIGQWQGKTLALVAASAACIMQLGAQMFAITMVASKLVSAPPKSLAMVEGPFGYDSRAFWEVMPMATAILMLVALISNWRTTRRWLIAASIGLFILGGMLAGMLVEPEFAAIAGGGYRDMVDPALVERGKRWLTLDWAVWGVSSLAGLTLLLALARPVAPRNR